jgi:hypothetical protein
MLTDSSMLLPRLRRLGVALPSTLVFDYPTTAAVAAYLTDRLAPPPAPDTHGTTTTTAAALASPHLGPHSLAAPAATSAVAVVAALARPFTTTAAAAGGLGGIPLADVISPVPLSRWDRTTIPAAAGLQAQYGGFMTDVDLFDAAAFGLSAGEAVAMDPQHRLLLEAAGELLAGPAAGAGLAAAAAGSGGVLGRAGVYLGLSWTEYHQLGRAHGVGSSTYSAQGAVLSVGESHEWCWVLLRVICFGWLQWQEQLLGVFTNASLLGTCSTPRCRAARPRPPCSDAAYHRLPCSADL